jgi:hypothetical protein
MFLGGVGVAGGATTWPSTHADTIKFTPNRPRINSPFARVIGFIAFLVSDRRPAATEAAGHGGRTL